MTSQPNWSPVDEQTGDLLDLLADDGSAIPGPDEEWITFKAALRSTARYGGGLINPNILRSAIGELVKPQRVGAFTHRALAQGLVEYTGEYVTSTDTKGRNGGKPCRELRWVG